MIRTNLIVLVPGVGLTSGTSDYFLNLLIRNKSAGWYTSRRNISKIYFTGIKNIFSIEEGRAIIFTKVPESAWAPLTVEGPFRDQSHFVIPLLVIRHNSISQADFFLALPQVKRSLSVGMLSGRVIQSRIMLSSSAESDYPARGQCSAHLSIPPILSALTAAPRRAGQNRPVIAANASRRQPQWAAAPLTHQKLVILMPELCFVSCRRPAWREMGGG